MMQRKLQTGRSMIEMLAVLTVIGVLTIGAVAGLNQAMQKFYTGKMHNDILSINADVVNLYAWQRGYPSSSSSSFQSDLCREGIFPDGCDITGKAYNPFGGIYTVTTNTEEQTMTIEATGLPESVCEDLTIKEWPYVVEEPTCSGTTFKARFE